MRPAELVLLSLRRQMSTRPFVKLMCMVPLRSSILQKIRMLALWLLTVPELPPSKPLKLPESLALLGNRLSRPLRLRPLLHQRIHLHRGMLFLLM